MLSDDFINRLRAGDMDAFRKLIDTYTPYVTTIVKNTCGMSLSSEDCEEIISDIFFNIWKNRKKLRYKITSTDDTAFLENDALLRAYIAKTAKNTTISRYRKEKKHLNNISIDDDTQNSGISLRGLQKSPEDICIETEEINELSKQMYNLTPAERELIIDYSLSDKTTRQLSKELGVNENTLKTRIKRIRNKMKEVLSYE